MTIEDAPGLRIPVSTYRLQFNNAFGFTDARRIIPYLNDLGITDIYASPYFKARQGSLHGYEIEDPNSLNPEVGSAEQYLEFVADLRAHSMGQILDIVPNHMCITCSGNTWWTDLLENGRSSFYSDFFDIDWSPVKRSLENKVLLPILGDQYGRVLEGQELRLNFEEGAFFVFYYDQRLPVMPDTYGHILKHRIEELESILSAESPHFVEYLSIITALNHLPGHMEKDPLKIEERFREKEIIKKRLLALCNENSRVRDFVEENVRIFNGIKGDHKSFNQLDELLSEQVWRLSHWRVATEEINYRRFFDINNLAAIRMEDPVVFQEAHKLIFRLIAKGSVTGLRVDHVDGLYNPLEYFQRLQKNCYLQTRVSSGKESNEAGSAGEASLDESVRHYEELLTSDPGYKPFYIVGEKILSRGEKMPDGWQIFGTTGYLFLNDVNGLFTDAGSAKAFDEIYSKFVGSRSNFQNIAYEKKKLVMEVSMSGEINALAQKLSWISERNRHTRDFTLNSLTKAIKEVIACFPVYRSYINSWEVKDKDRQNIENAISKAKRRNPAISSYIFNFLRDVLLLNYQEEYEGNDRNDWLDFVMRFQQITGPVMAKGIEDTAFYAYNRFVSLNEVGGSPERFGSSVEAFHGQNIERLKFWPNSLLTTSTHDTKRSEDARARMNVLSEVPRRWKECLAKWSRFNRRKKQIVDGQAVPDRNEEYLLYQTLIGVWPLSTDSEEDSGIFRDRIRNYMLKAVREAKVNTSWINPDNAYESALMSFVDTVLNPVPGNRFLSDFIGFQKIISRYGMYNSLSQVLLKTTSPGVPDFYQGTEIWDFSLVDPDNRRTVDYDVRRTTLDAARKKIAGQGLASGLRELLSDWEWGGIKLFVTCNALGYRRENKRLFSHGTYLPLISDGEKNDHVCAFARVQNDKTVVVAVPRLVAGLLEFEDKPPFGKDAWGDTWLVVPDELGADTFRNIFTDETVVVNRQFGKRTLPLADIFASFPVAMLEAQKSG
ncbi:MAG TPA: malto-oligosyltrehalose synthase [Thermodesulfovibrionales bacterium]|nr:malto-oligosyltrehalose synthase [Thermodesulfovibrionales bacterium]